MSKDATHVTNPPGIRLGAAPTIRVASKALIVRDGHLLVTVNSDDPAYFGGRYVTENLLLVHDAATLSRDELLRLQRNAFEVAWLPNSVKDGYLAELDSYATST